MFADESQVEACRFRLAAEGRCDGVFAARRLDGHDIEVQYVASIYKSPIGEPEGVLLNMFDITRQRELERTVLEMEGRLRLEQDRFRHLIESATEGLLVLSSESIISYASPSAQDLLGAGAVRGADARAMFDQWADAEEAAGVREVTRSMGSAESAQRTLSLRLPDHPEPRQIELTITNLLENPSIRGMVVHLRDVTERQRHLRELRDRSLTDELTGLANRALLMDHLDEELRHAGAAQLGVLFLDLDHFKLVNDSYGHTVGDALLCTIADRLRRAVRDQDLVARFGGDEFVVVHRIEHPGSAGRATTLSLAERLLLEVSRPVELDEVALAPSVSIGVTFSDEVARTSEALVRDADMALHRAKEEGRRRISLYEPELRHAVLRRLRLEQDLALAIEDRALFMVYQPIVDLLTGDVVGCESLCRWTHQELGPIPPTEFIAVAEDTGRIGELGLWVVEAVCTDLSTPQRWGGRVPGHVAVNVSAQQFHDPGFGSALMRVLAAHDVQPSRVVLEITESMLLSDSAESRTTLEQLRDHGLRLSIDDFGTGYSSLSYLARCPLDFIKVDRSFVADLHHQEHLVRAIIAMARALDVAVIAEGVETRDQFQLLRELGCDYAQGYLLARPGPPNAMADRIEPLQDVR
jgi:diguanylate cyclase (GGDEF)-like protein